VATSLWSQVFGPPCTIIRISATTVSNVSFQIQHDALVSVAEICTSHELQRLCCQQRRHKQKQHKVHVISPTSLQHNTSNTMFSWTFLEVSLNSKHACTVDHTNYRKNCMYSECTGRCLNSAPVRKRFGHSLQTYGFTASCRWTCTLRSCLRLNFIWQMSHVNQVPSLCDFSRCVLSWSCHVKQSEQCLHEYGFASVW